jgi:hypothetical protein
MAMPRAWPWAVGRIVTASARAMAFQPINTAWSEAVGLGDCDAEAPDTAGETSAVASAAQATSAVVATRLARRGGARFLVAGMTNPFFGRLTERW